MSYNKVYSQKKKKKKKKKKFLYGRKFFGKLFYFFKKGLSNKDKKGLANLLIKTLPQSERNFFVERYLEKKLTDNQKQKLDNLLSVARIRLLKNRAFFFKFCFYNFWFVSKLNSMRKI